MSTWAVYHQLSAKQEHNRRSCISPSRYRCISTAITNISESIPGPNSRVDQGGISTAKAVYQQQSKTKAKALLIDTVVSTWAVPQPGTAKQKHLWRSCISPARYSCISTAINKKNQAKTLLDDTAVSTRAVYPPRKLYINSNQNESESTSDRHGRVDLGGVSTAISKAKASLAQLYITSAVRLYTNSNKK